MLIFQTTSVLKWVIFAETRRSIVQMSGFTITLSEDARIILQCVLEVVVFIDGCQSAEISNFGDALAFVQRLFIENAYGHNSRELVYLVRY